MEKEKSKYPIGGYAPGNYSCRCTNCKAIFQGDKRAVQCEPCAVEMVKEESRHTPYRGKVWESEQETVEEAAERLNKLKHIEFPLDPDADHILAVANVCYKEGVKAGSKWQQERSYSEEDMRDYAMFYYTFQGKASEHLGKDLFKVWKEQVKKK